MKYTKGKWITQPSLEGQEKGTIHILLNGYMEPNGWIADALGPHVGPCQEEVIANAKLISKAPEMYEGLKGVIRLKELIMPPPNIPAVHQNEAKAIMTMISKIESLLKDLES